MTNRERIIKVLNFESVDRLPLMEWATWWDKTVERWKSEGVPRELDKVGLFHYWELDDQRQFWFSNRSNFTAAHRLPDIDAYIRNEEDYERVLPTLYPENAVECIKEELIKIKPLHDRGDIIVWITLEGFFWWPRVLLGIEPHLYSFYDQKELYHRICRDALEHHKKIISEFCEILTPDFMTYAEDMSYNHGPMISKEHFDEFIKPYYEQLNPILKQHGIRIIVDTDGNVMPMVPWLLESGIEGILPLERQSGVDANLLREKFPGLLMLGAYDKMVMKHGEQAMRKEFERLAPVMSSGGFICSVDHQTPPDVSADTYRVYRALLQEYCEKYHP